MELEIKDKNPARYNIVVRANYVLEFIEENVVFSELQQLLLKLTAGSLVSIVAQPSLNYNTPALLNFLISNELTCTVSNQVSKELEAFNEELDSFYRYQACHQKPLSVAQEQLLLGCE